MSHDRPLSDDVTAKYRRFVAKCAGLTQRLASVRMDLMTWADWKCGVASIDSAAVIPIPTKNLLDMMEAVSADLVLLTEPPILRTGILGGTQVGKSTIFNYLAGADFAGVSKRAAATRWPLVLLPAELASDAAALVKRLFPLFEPRPWEENYDTSIPVIGEAPPVFFRIAQPGVLPEHLVLVDAPDVDGKEKMNRTVAEKMAKCVDVVIAVSSNQKYNDEKPNDFFRASLRDFGRRAILVLNVLPAHVISNKEFVEEMFSKMRASTGPELSKWAAESTAEAHQQPQALRLVRWGADGVFKQSLRDVLHALEGAVGLKMGSVIGMLVRLDESLGEFEGQITSQRDDTRSALSMIRSSISEGSLHLVMPPGALAFQAFGKWARKNALLGKSSLLSLRFFGRVGDVVLLRRWRKKDSKSGLAAWQARLEKKVADYLSLVHAKLAEVRGGRVGALASDAIRARFKEVRETVAQQLKSDVLGFQSIGESTEPKGDTLVADFTIAYHALLDELYADPERKKQIDKLLFWIKTYSYGRPLISLVSLGFGGWGVEQAVSTYVVTAAKEAAIAAAKETSVAITKEALAAVGKNAALSVGKEAALVAGGAALGGGAAAYTGEGWRAVVQWVLAGGTATLLASIQRRIFSAVGSSSPFADYRTALERLESETERRSEALGELRSALAAAREQAATSSPSTEAQP